MFLYCSLTKSFYFQGYINQFAASAKIECGFKNCKRRIGEVRKDFKPRTGERLSLLRDLIVYYRFLNHPLTRYLTERMVTISQHPLQTITILYSPDDCHDAWNISGTKRKNTEGIPMPVFIKTQTDLC